MGLQIRNDWLQISRISPQAIHPSSFIELVGCFLCSLQELHGLSNISIIMLGSNGTESMTKPECTCGKVWTIEPSHFYQGEGNKGKDTKEGLFP
jgi:hypothetical protein